MRIIVQKQRANRFSRFEEQLSQTNKQTNRHPFNESNLEIKTVQTRS